MVNCKNEGSCASSPGVYFNYDKQFFSGARNDGHRNVDALTKATLICELDRDWSQAGQYHINIANGQNACEQGQDMPSKTSCVAIAKHLGYEYRDHLDPNVTLRSLH